MKKLIILLYISAISTSSLNAQTDWHLKDMGILNWQIATPLSTDYLKETSLSGGSAEYRRFIKPNMSVGIGFSWNSFE